MMKHLKLRICKDFNKNLHGMTLNLESDNHPTGKNEKERKTTYAKYKCKKVNSVY